MKAGLPSYNSTKEAIKKDRDMKEMETSLAHRMHTRLNKVTRFDTIGDFGPYPGYQEDKWLLSTFHDMVLNFEIRSSVGSLTNPTGKDILDVLYNAGDMNMGSGEFSNQHNEDAIKPKSD